LQTAFHFFQWIWGRWLRKLVWNSVQWWPLCRWTSLEVTDFGTDPYGPYATSY